MQSPAQGRFARGPRFVTHVIDGELTSGYQPVVTGLNRDGRPDVIGLSTRTEELAWYENPGWERHVLTTGLSRSINAAARDPDGDGIPEIALGARLLVPTRREEAGSWERRVIDEIGSGRTIVTADFDGDGRDEIVTGNRGDTRRLYLYAAVDADGAAWSRHVLDEDMSPSGCAVADMNGDARIDLVCIGGRTANLKCYENVSP